MNSQLSGLESYKVLSQEDSMNIEGGLVVTGKMVAAGFVLFTGSVSFGYWLGTRFF